MPLTYVQQLEQRVRTLEADLRSARTQLASYQLRVTLLEESARRAWAMATWGGPKKRANGGDHADG